MGTPETPISPRPLEYAPVCRPAIRRYLTKRAILVILPLVGLLASPFIECRHEQMWVDAVTGSMRYQTIWPFGLTQGLVMEPSPLEARLKRMGKTVSPAWTFLTETDGNIYGGVFSQGCNTVGTPILSARPMLESFATNATDGEILALVATMQCGTDAQKQAAINQALSRAYSSY